MYKLPTALHFSFEIAIFLFKCIILNFFSRRLNTELKTQKSLTNDLQTHLSKLKEQMKILVLEKFPPIKFFWVKTEFRKMPGVEVYLGLC